MPSASRLPSGENRGVKYGWLLKICVCVLFEPAPKMGGPLGPSHPTMDHISGAAFPLAYRNTPFCEKSNCPAPEPDRLATSLSTAAVLPCATSQFISRTSP